VLTEEERKIRRGLTTAKYRVKNIEKIRITTREHWLGNKELILERNRARYIEQRDIHLDRGKVYREQNKDLVLANQKKYAATEKGKAAQTIAKQMRRARVWKADNTLTSFDRFCISEAIELRKLRKELTGINWHIDHIIPVSKGGKTTFDNIQVVPAKWNQSKSNLHNDLYFTKHEVAING